jgi:predicted O-linked N-acetylglucosamine transferase (SPINDLY family)
VNYLFVKTKQPTKKFKLMNESKMPTEISNWQKQAQQYLIEENYQAAAKLYEKAITEEPDVKSYYWHLGLLLLLQDQETEAQLTWFSALSAEEEIDHDTQELLELLDTEAKRRIIIEDYYLAWVIRQHIKELASENIDNLLHLAQIVLQLTSFQNELSVLLTKISDSLVNTADDCKDNYDFNLLIDSIKKFIVYQTEESEISNSIFNFVKICLQNHYDNFAADIIEAIMTQCVRLSAFYRRPDLATKYAELCLERIKNANVKHIQREILTLLSHFYQNNRQFQQGIETAKLCYELSENLAEKICANYVVIRGLMSSGSYWQEAYECLQKQILLVEDLIETNPTEVHIVNISRLFLALFPLPYFEDQPARNHKIQHQLSSFCQSHMVKYHQDIAQEQQKYLYLRKQNLSENKKVLNIGYISHCFKRHSVSWLCRWIFKYHNRDKFKIHSYFFNDAEQVEMFTESYFVSKSDNFYKFGTAQHHDVWNQIRSDEIDILVDLDSLTLDQACDLLSVKSAPIQVTWLGWDSSGLPSIDYFIGDPYVLPESAQDYYSETIWRLPQTYIAVDGFEIDVPNLRREDLGIPDDAIVYFMTQKGYKRHQPHLHLQMKIIKEVPNSYLLIKGDADIETSKVFFEEIAEQENVDFSRIKFLPYAPSELIHRANLQIADVVLDTYPYNGATTTLETLWIGIPLVTKVGEQFSARNSYGMMMNVGITEGLAWTDDEFVEWGVRLGKDEKLRQQISWKLRQSRHSAPLWNAKQFTRDMENAYEQMWQRYIDSK